MTKAARVFLAFAALAVFGASLQAQDAEDKKSKKEQAGLRSIEGTVLDSSDQPATGAVVQLKDMRSLQVRSFIAQDLWKGVPTSHRECPSMSARQLRPGAAR